ncbi:MAG TPA: glycosyltransferase family 9 protein [Flavisolibacter sp.]|nr:glycosyltransferase family 9 protein [Flavisolibacter sp.]
MKILVRLPNWLGDMVMAVATVQQLPHFFPDCTVSVIAKQGIHQLLPYFPPMEHQFVFKKEEYRGPKGLWKFGRMIRQTEKFDLYLSLPDSFSAALMGFATGAKKRVGFRNEARSILLTHSFAKPAGLHRVAEYLRLPELFTKMESNEATVSLRHSFVKEDHVVININSEASSRRLTVAKAVEIISATRQEFPHRIVLIGGPKEKEFVASVASLLPNPQRVEVVAGKTSLPQLVELLASAKVVLSTDSGPAHLANALGTQTIVLFGAGNENNTAPYNKENCQVIRLGKLSCEPCTKNVCVRFDTPQCLELLDTNQIIAAMHQKLINGN